MTSGVSSSVVPSSTATTVTSSPRKTSLDTKTSPHIEHVHQGSSNFVPKSRRRGLFSHLTLVAEVENPKKYRRSVKWIITFIVAAAAALVTTGENMLYRMFRTSHASHQIIPCQTSSDLNASLSVTNLSLSLSKISIAICPLWWSSFSETSGRRTVYIISFLFFVLWSILAAVSNSISMLIAMRILSQSAASSVQAIGAGTIADIWEVKERGTAMGIFYLGPLVGGTTLGPVLGGILTETLGWRSTQWFLAIYGGLVFVLILFCLPETLEAKASRPPPHSQSQGEKATDKSTAEWNGQPVTTAPEVQASIPPPHPPNSITQLKSILFDPFRCLTYLRFPILSTTILLASITFGTLAFQSISVQDTFSSPPYSMSTLVVGLLYLPIGIGNVLGSIFGGRWSDYVMHRQARKAGRYDGEGNLVFWPEERARENAWVGVLLANFLTGISAMIIFGLVTTMLTEFLPSRPASAVALNSMGRNLFACVGFAVAQPWLEACGNGWVFTAAAGMMAVGGGGVIWGLGRWGRGWREGMRTKVEG
ncbi:MAG: hypothetical protein Q9220_003335 [cf. Caloplaca sp. 1 TL-2023]